MTVVLFTSVKLTASNALNFTLTFLSGGTKGEADMAAVGSDSAVTPTTVNHSTESRHEN